VNTKLFHAFANGRKCKCTILSLEDENGQVSDPWGIQGIIYAFYGGLMGSEEPKTLSLQQNIWSPNMQVNAQENEDLL
jgi:hypothetical protein